MSVGISLYDVTMGDYISVIYDTTTASSYTRPSKSGYTYLGWVWHGSHEQCISYYNSYGVESSSTTCSGYSDGDVVMFFYSSGSSGGDDDDDDGGDSGGTTYYYKAYDMTEGEYITSERSTTSSYITCPNVGSGYTYVGYKYHTSFSKCLS